LAKSGSGQISSQIWQTAMQLQYVQLIITDKTNAADADLSRSSGVFTILISDTRMKKIQTRCHFHKFRQKLANSDITKEALNCTASL